MKLIFHTFITHDKNDYLMIYDASQTELIIGKIFGTQTSRENVIVHGNGAFLEFKTSNSHNAAGFKLEFQCYSLTPNGKRCLRPPGGL